ncbi:MAG: phospholipase D-like domain-containing protein [Propionibacteriaceae bacterium]|nr:phospholipase D-like domain-containing protein [Propionibacteriaceae bacterium]
MSGSGSRARGAFIAWARMLFTGLALLAQIALLVVAIWYFRSFSPWVLAAQLVLALAVMTAIVSSDLAPEYKLAWILPLSIAPVFGSVFYLLYGFHPLTARERRRSHQVEENARKALAAVTQPPPADLSPSASRQSEYLSGVGGFPRYDRTGVGYYPLGEAGFAQMLRDLEQAESYILFQYFIISAGHMWDQIFAVLSRKAHEGVEVRVLYDDVGSHFTIPRRFHQTLTEAGIKVQAINPLRPRLSLRYNHRDHRKILVIDGRVGFTGGINIGDEYINRIEVYGHWKDNLLRLEGPAVWSLAVIFFTAWDASSTPTPLEGYRPAEPAQCEEAGGWVQPFTDSPYDDLTVGLDTYLSLFSQAKQSVDILTPYLILDARTTATLVTAARSGVRVRIVTPHIGDSWLVHEATRSFYGVLVSAGVEVYEYTPGYMHAKVVVADGDTAVVGTINFDYRSFYLHHENAVWLHRVPAIAEITADFGDVLAHSQPVGPDALAAVPWWRRGVRAVVRVFAPLL